MEKITDNTKTIILHSPFSPLQLRHSNSSATFHVSLVYILLHYLLHISLFNSALLFSSPSMSSSFK
jgi:hypothetical protein